MSEMVQDLIAQGIRLNNHNIGSHKTVCPRCSHTRKKKKDPCLWVNVTEHNKAMWKCHNCLWTGAAGNVTHGSKDEAPKREYKKPEPVKDDSSLPKSVQEFFTGRGISIDVVKRNKIFFDENKSAIAFPYYVRGELINIKYRTLDKRFSMTSGARLTLYGLDDIREVWQGKKRELIIVEGEMDKLALEMCGFRNVLSVPNGAPASIKEGDEIDNTGAFAYIAHAETLLREAESVILAVDDDKAGENLRYELARRIGAAKCSIVKFPHKDANGCLQNLGGDIILDCLNDAKPYPIAGLHEVDGMMDDLLKYYNEGMCAGLPTGFPNIDRYYTVMPGELTVVTGIPNSGKSEFLDALMINLAKNENWKFAVFSPEGVKEAHIAQLIEKVIGLPSAPKAPNRMSVDQFMNGAAWVNKYFYFIRADNEEQLPTVDYVLEKATQAVMRYGVNAFLLDPWNELEHSRPAELTDTEYVGRALAKISRWAKNRYVKVFIVAHPTKIAADKDGKVRVPTLYDILGSSNWFNKADNGITIHRSDDVADTTEVHIKKVRSKFVGRKGKCDLRYNRSTGIYSVPPDYEKYDGVTADEPDVVSWE